MAFFCADEPSPFSVPDGHELEDAASPRGARAVVVGAAGRQGQRADERHAGEPAHSLDRHSLVHLPCEVVARQGAASIGTLGRLDEAMDGRR